MKTQSTTLSENSPALTIRLNRHFVACSAAVACVAGASIPQQAQGAIVYSGIKNLALPAVGGGQLYLDFVLGTTYSSIPGQSGLDWDIAPYGGGLTNQSSYSLVTVILGGKSANLASGTPIDASSAFFAAPGGIQNVDIPDHTTGIIGFMFNPNSTDGFTTSTPTNYGWFRLSVDTVTGGKIVDWAYETTPAAGIAAAAVPEPSALGCLALGALGLGTMRRRKAAMAA
jgi:hypothetical protein